MDRKTVDRNKITPMMKQYLEIKEKNEDIILFFRLGDFYEMFFDDAEKISKELELTLTGKSCGLEERVPMCGIPYHAASSYINKLIEKGYKIGICEQLEDPKNVKGIVKRGIVQIISSGTTMDDESLNASDFNYIGSLTDYKHAYVLSYADVSTGEIASVLIEHNKTKIISEIIAKSIKELIISTNVDKDIYSILKNQFHMPITITDEKTDEYKEIYEGIEDYRYIESVKHLLAYIIHNQKSDLAHMQKLKIEIPKNYLRMDIHTQRNLELIETIRQKNRNYSLVWLLDKTKTAMGARLLKKYILNPLVDKEKINKRYDTVETLLKEFILKADLEKYLEEVYDLERLSGKIAFGNANGKDLLQLKRSLKALPHISEILSQINYEKNMETLDNLYELLEESIYEEPPITIKEGYLIKEGYNKELDELKKLRKGGKNFIAKFEKEEREKTGIKNLKVAYNRVFGYYIEISKGNLKEIKDEWGYERKQTLVNAERFISPILKEQEALILNAEEKIIELEYNLFINIRNETKKYIPNLQKIAKTISEIDVLSSFATVSENNNYTRPEIVENEIEIKDSRHPVVEKVIKDEFVTNDITMDKNTNILLITGPNMAGKST
ncbi:MAG: DNA mismatch repair protein MutS, partial [Bacilli bacterium]|nr:DNA mismatch repair protein MutS [Bacilli bacterium]